MSGDIRDTAQDTSEQLAQISENGLEIYSDVRIYAELVFIVEDNAGNQYTLVEIEGETITGGGRRDVDYFAFVGDAPPPGTELTVVGVNNVAGEEGVSYTDIGRVNQTPELAPASFTVSQSSPAGAVVGTVVGIDPDAGDVLTYAIASGNESGAFAIDPVLGTITITDPAAIDFTNQSYALTITADDGYGGQAAATVTIDLNAAPVFAAGQTLSLPKDAPANVRVGTVVVSDTTVGDTLTFEITGGNETGAFDIDTTTGEIFVADPAAVGYFSTTSYELEVSVTDSGGNVTTGTVAIEQGDAVASIWLDRDIDPTVAYRIFGSARVVVTQDPDTGEVTSMNWSSDRMGYSVSGGGDINGDGIDDLVTGLPTWRGRFGAAEVIYGDADGLAHSDFAYGHDPRLPTDDISMIYGTGFEFLGYSVAIVEDINNDGIDDILAGSPTGVRVVYGKQGGLDAWISVNSGYLDGTAGYTVLDSANEHLGTSVVGLGDVNGDGIGDFAVGGGADDPQGNNATAAGRAYVVFGTEGDVAPTLDISTLAADGRGFAIQVGPSGNQETVVGSAGDINGDGINDIIVSQPRGDVAGFEDVGQVGVIFGSATGFDPIIDFDDLDGSNGFHLFSSAGEGFTGFDVHGAGDVNGDGYDDLVVGAPLDYSVQDPNPGGLAYVVFGKADGFSSSIDLTTLDGTNGFAVEALSDTDHFGSSVSNAGDVNGDGIDDFIVGAFAADPLGDGIWNGQTVVIYGRTDGFDATLKLADIDGTNGFFINGMGYFDLSAADVSSSDINGDGFSDVIVGESLSDERVTNIVDYAQETNSQGEVFLYGEAFDDVAQDGGATWVIYGGNFTGDVDVLGTAGEDTLTGGSADEVINGAQGDDTITGNGGNDILTGASGADTFVFADGSGNDVIRDFELGIAGAVRDVIDVSGFGPGLTFDDIVANAEAAPDGLILHFDENDSVKLVDFNVSDLSVDLFVF